MCRIAPTLRRILASAFAAAGLAATDAGTDWCSARPAFAQPPSGDRGGGDRGGSDRGRRMFDPEEMIGRMDENKNGQVDPEEMQGRSRFFLESMARDNGLDLSKPIPTSKLKELMQARFQQGGGSRGPSSGSSNGSGSGSSSNSSNTTKPTSIPPMGFGVETKIAKVPGFGPDATADSWDTIKAKYDQRIVDRVQDSLNRYDTNKDGILDAEEIKKGQWRSDPKESDLNKDGKLSRSELAERQRLRDQNGGGGGPGGGSSGGRPSFGGGFPGGGFGGGGFGGGGTGPTAATTTPATTSTAATVSTSSSSSSSSSGSSGGATQIAGYADGLLKQYDTNKDGVLQRDEWAQMSSKRQKADTNNDGLITKDEIIAQLSDYSKSGGSSSSGSSGSPTYGARAASSGAASRGTVKTYRFLAPVERLPKGLPDWFARSDANGDGQIAMSEFSAAWDEAKAAEFAKWDRNGDGLITPRECTSEK